MSSPFLFFFFLPTVDLSGFGSSRGLPKAIPVGTRPGVPGCFFPLEKLVCQVVGAKGLKVSPFQSEIRVLEQQNN